MHSPGPAEPADSGADRPRRPPQRGAVATLVVGAGMAVVSVVGLLGGQSGTAAAPPPAPASTTVPPARAPAAAPAAAPASASLGPWRRTPARLLHVPPVSVAVPSVRIDSTLVDLGLAPDRTLEPPADYHRAGWYAAGSYPGDADGPPAVIAGHVDSWDGPAVFHALHRVRVGQQVRVRRADRSVAVFDVYAIHRYPKDEFPSDTVYAPTAEAEIRLITCTGSFDRDRRSYLDNLVLFARLDATASENAP